VGGKSNNVYDFGCFDKRFHSPAQKTCDFKQGFDTETLNYGILMREQ